MPTAVSIYISHADQDEALRDELLTHLAPLQAEGRIAPWHRALVEGGEDRLATIQRQLEAARVVLLLLSPDYLASDACMEEARQALRRQEAGEVKVVPILVRPCDLGAFPVADLQLIPRSGLAIARQGSDRDAEWLQVVIEIRVVLKLPGQAPPPTGPGPDDRPSPPDPSGPAHYVALLLVAVALFAGLLATAYWFVTPETGPLLLASFSLVAAVVLGGGLHYTSVVKTKIGAFTGASATFVGTYIMLSTIGSRDRELVLHGEIVNLPPETTPEIFVDSCQGVLKRPANTFEVTVYDGCAKSDPLKVVARAGAVASVTKQVPIAEAKQAVRLDWNDAQQPQSLRRVIECNQKPFINTRVEVHCGNDKVADGNTDGNGVLAVEGLRPCSAGYMLWIFAANNRTEVVHAGADAKIDLTGEGVCPREPLHAPHPEDDEPPIVKPVPVTPHPPVAPSTEAGQSPESSKADCNKAAAWLANQFPAKVRDKGGSITMNVTLENGRITAINGDSKNELYTDAVNTLNKVKSYPGNLTCRSIPVPWNVQ